MNIESEKKVIWHARKARFGNVAFAANVLALPENDDQVSFLDLVECLKQGNRFREFTNIHLVAAAALYRRTGRKRKPGIPGPNFITDPHNWLSYLEEHGFIKKAVSKTPRKRPARERRPTRSS